MVYAPQAMGIKYVTGDATQPQGAGRKIICHVNNNIGGWGRGFVLALNKRWAAPEESYRRWYLFGDQEGFELGAIRLVRVSADTWVANMIAQHDVRTIRGRPPIRYSALQLCLTKLRAEASHKSASVHMPRMGAGLAGGNWSTIEMIVQRTLTEFMIPVTVYTLPE